ncbi:MAG TPA: hypothetical protein VN329_08215, partial [Roseomonas sp.]|nr:hypothetical protein [Roseomonas sp.]
FLRTIEDNRAILEPEIFTQMLQGGGQDLAGWTAWDLDRDAARLRRHSGGLAMRVRLKDTWPHPRAVQTGGVLAPATFAAWLDDPEDAIARLARIVPPDLVDTPFPGEPAKFDLVNGWRVARSTGATRTGFRRARLFRTRAAGEDRLRYEIRAPAPASFALKVNARPVGGVQVGTAWTAAEIDVSSVAPGDAFVLEFAREGEAANFDEGCFTVRLPGVEEPRMTFPGPAARRGLRRRLGTLLARLRQRLGAD